MNNLALSLSDLSDAAGARDFLEQALAVQRRVLGDEHPDTLMSMHNLLGTQHGIDSASVDQELVAELLSGVAKLPEGVPIRVAAEQQWLKSST